MHHVTLAELSEEFTTGARVGCSTERYIGDVLIQWKLCEHV